MNILLACQIPVLQTEFLKVHSELIAPYVVQTDEDTVRLMLAMDGEHQVIDELTATQRHHLLAYLSMVQLGSCHFSSEQTLQASSGLWIPT